MRQRTHPRMRVPEMPLGKLALTILVLLILSANDATFHYSFAVTDRGVAVEEAPSGQKLNRLYHRDWAVVIGINSYHSLPPLAYAVNDAQAFAKTLTELGVPQSNIFILVDDAATKRGIESVLADRLKDVTSSHDRIFFFFAGHGVTQTTNNGEEGFLMPVDADEKHIYSTAISMRALREIAMRLPAKHVFFAVDSCYSGYAVTRGVLISQKLEITQAFTEQRAIQVLTAGQRGQLVMEDGGHGIFTKYLLAGMKGSADINRDGILTVMELGQWTQAQVIRESERRQVPMFGTLDGEGQFVIRWDLDVPPPTEVPAQHDIDPWAAGRKVPAPIIREPSREVSLDEIYVAAGQPRIAISVNEFVDAKPSGTRTTEHILESELRQSGLRVFVAKGDRRNDHEAADAADPGKAEILITGRNDIRFSRTVTVENQTFYFYRPELTVRAIRNSTKEIIASSSPKLDDEIDSSAVSRGDAVDRAAREVAKAAVADLRNKLKEYWVSRATGGDLFALMVRGIGSKKLAEFEQFLRRDPRTRSVLRRRFEKQQGQFEVQFAGTQSGFIDFLSESKFKPKLLLEEDHNLEVALD